MTDKTEAPSDAATPATSPSPPSPPAPPAPASPPPRRSPKDSADGTEEGSSGIGSWLLVIVAIVAIVGLYLLARMRTEAQGSQELPLMSIQVEYDAMTPDVRKRIVDLEKALVTATDPPSFDVFGPASQKYLVPGSTVPAMAIPQARTFAAISQDDWDRAWPYFVCGDWLVPRIFRIDGKACVIRVAPHNGERRFAPDAGARVTKIVADWMELNNGIMKAPRVYSSSAHLGGDAERDALDVTFGATTAWVKMDRGTNQHQNPISWRSIDSVKLLDKVKPALSKNGHIRSLTTPLSWLKYYMAVEESKPAEPKPPSDVALINRAFDFAHANSITSYLDTAGGEALVAVTTDLEGRANLELYYYLASTMQSELRVNVHGNVPALKEGPAPEKKSP